MSEPVLRVFHRADREQLTGLVNAHITTVVRGRAVSAAVLLAHSSGTGAPRAGGGDPGRRLAEAQDDHTRGGSLARLDGWADLAELHVAEGHRGQGIGTWLVEHLVAWLRLGGARRFLGALGEEDRELEPWSDRFGSRRIGAGRRGRERRPG